MATDLDLLFISLYWMNVKVMVRHDVTSREASGIFSEAV